MSINKVELNELTTIAKSIKSFKEANASIYFNNGIVVTVSTGRSFFANFVKNTLGELAIKYVETEYSKKKVNGVTIA